MIENTIAVILAAGGRKKMKSAFPRAMTKILSKPMVEWVLRAAQKSGAEKIVVVTGEHDKIVRDCVGDRAECVIQYERKGTGRRFRLSKRIPTATCLCLTAILL